MGPGAMLFVLWTLSFEPAFSVVFFTFIRRLFSSSLLSAIRVSSSAYLRLLIFLLAIFIPACAVILEPKKRKPVIVSTFSPSICHAKWGRMPWFQFILVLLSWLFHFTPSPSSGGSLVPLCFLPLEWYHLCIWACLYFSWPWLSTYFILNNFSFHCVPIYFP